MTVTSNLVSETVLAPSLEALALNHQQRRRVYDPSEETDSLLEHLLRTEPKNSPARQHLKRAAELAVEVVQLNHGEAEQVRLISSTADRMVSELHILERDGSGESRSAEAVASRVRGPLGALMDPGASPVEVRHATFRVAGLFERLPASAIFTPHVERSLGGRRFRLLRELWAEWSA